MLLCRAFRLSCVLLVSYDRTAYMQSPFMSDSTSGTVWQLEQKTAILPWMLSLTFLVKPLRIVIRMKFAYSYNNSNNNWSKIFDERPHCRHVTLTHLIHGYSGSHGLVPQTTSTCHPSHPLAHMSQLNQFISFCIHCCKGSQYYSLGWTTPKHCPFSLGIGPPHLIHGSLGPPESARQTVSWLVQPFSQVWRMWLTDRQTDNRQKTLHGTLCVAIGHYRYNGA